MPQFITNLDLTKNQLLNFAVQNLASAPGTPVEGQMYYNTTDDKLYYRTASAWVAIEASAGTYTLPIATTTILGGVKDGAGVTIDAAGVLSVDYGAAVNTSVQGNDARVTADQAAGTASIRTIGSGALQAAAGNHNHTVDSLSNVVISSNTDNEILAWDSTTSKWINQTAAEAGLSAVGHTHTNDHVAATVLDSTSIDLTLTGQQISAAAIFGTVAGTVAEGNHSHTPYTLPIASTSVLGGVKDGTGVTVDGTGVLSVDYGSGAGTSVQGNDARVTADQAAATASIRTIGTGSLQAAAGNHSHANDHVAVTVADTASIDLTLTGQQVSAAVIFGTTATTVAQGNHSHTSFADLTITGNLVVNGTTTTINTTEMVVSDNMITLNNDVTGVPTENAGVEVERGSSANVSLLWNETSDTWTQTKDGTNYHAIPGKFVGTIGDGAATSFVLTHNLNTRDVSVTIRRTGTPYDIVIADVECTSVNTITVYTAAAPTSAQYTVVIQG
jgi:hypothetical protein